MTQIQTQKRAFGRLPRAFSPAMPHMSVLRMMAFGAGVALSALPTEIHYAEKLPTNLGMMLNDRLGDCSIAGLYHAGQVWSFHGRNGTILTEPDSLIEKAYEEFCNYNPQQPNTDCGGVLQYVLRDALKSGFPISEGAVNNIPGRSKLRFVAEASPTNVDAVKRAIVDTGGVYIGFNVPEWMEQGGPLPQVWTLNGPISQNGHCVFCPGYSPSGVDVISWGHNAYVMDWKMFEATVEEVYALVHPWWFDATGKTPFGLPIATLETQMKAYLQGF